MIPPSKSELQAYAGWSLVARNQCSDQQHMALCRFGDAAGELSEVIEDLPAAKAPRPAPVLSSPVADRPAAALSLHGLCEEVRLDGPCRHEKFDIHTQRCLQCGITYRQARGHPAELM